MTTELNALRKENAALRARITELEAKLAEGVKRENRVTRMVKALLLAFKRPLGGKVPTDG